MTTYTKHVTTQSHTIDQSPTRANPANAAAS